MYHLTRNIFLTIIFIIYSQCSVISNQSNPYYVGFGGDLGGFGGDLGGFGGDLGPFSDYSIFGYHNNKEPKKEKKKNKTDTIAHLKKHSDIYLVIGGGFILVIMCPITFMLINKRISGS
ncbi:hypothetical protein SNEBB_003078 [Seison nebaliae]|nr:hypothetical protein SNEBB_003078 [Seison nebaliae]